MREIFEEVKRELEEKIEKLQSEKYYHEKLLLIIHDPTHFGAKSFANAVVKKAEEYDIPIALIGMNHSVRTHRDDILSQIWHNNYLVIRPLRLDRSEYYTLGLTGKDLDATMDKSKNYSKSKFTVPAVVEAVSRIIDKVEPKETTLTRDASCLDIVVFNESDNIGLPLALDQIKSNNKVRLVDLSYEDVFSNFCHADVIVTALGEDIKKYIANFGMDTTVIDIGLRLENGKWLSDMSEMPSSHKNNYINPHQIGELTSLIIILRHLKG